MSDNDASGEPLRVTESPPGAEATYSFSDQPTNQPTDQPGSAHGCKGGEYMSCRITIGHDSLQAVLDVFNGTCFCLWPHTGANKDNQHYHVLVLIPFADDSRKSVEKIRKRIKDKLGLSGPGKVMVKLVQGELVHGITYCSKEDTSPIYQDSEFWEQLFRHAPAWVPPAQYKQSMLPKPAGRTKDSDSDWQLTYANFIPKCVNHARVKGLTGGLKPVLQDLIETTRWRPSYHMVKNGVPDYYYKDFEFRTGKRKRADMDWMTPKF